MVVGHSVFTTFDVEFPFTVSVAGRGFAVLDSMEHFFSSGEPVVGVAMLREGDRLVGVWKRWDDGLPVGNDGLYRLVECLVLFLELVEGVLGCRFGLGCVLEEFTSCEFTSSVDIDHFFPFIVVAFSPEWALGNLPVEVSDFSRFGAGDWDR